MKINPFTNQNREEKSFMNHSENNYRFISYEQMIEILEKLGFVSLPSY